MRAVDIRKYFLFLAMFVLGSGVLLLVYWSFAARDVLEIKNEPFPTRTIRETAHPRGVIILKIDYCKKVNAEGRVRTSFVSASREIFLPVSYDNQKPQCLETELPVLIPKDLPPDKYKIHFMVRYQVNPLKEVLEEFDSQEFTVEP